MDSWSIFDQVIFDTMSERYYVVSQGENGVNTVLDSAGSVCRGPEAGMVFDPSRKEAWPRGSLLEEVWCGARQQ